MWRELDGGDMGQLCSCFSSSATARNEEAVAKDRSPPGSVPKVSLNAAPTESVSDSVAVPPQRGAPLPDAVTAIRALVQEAQGKSFAARSPRDTSVLEDDNASRENALDELQLEVVLAKWDEDQRATLERLEKAMQLLQSKGLARQQAASPAGAAVPGPFVPPPSATAAAAADVLREAEEEVSGIFHWLHAPHGPRAEALVRDLRAQSECSRVLAAHATLRVLCEETGFTMAELKDKQELLGVDVGLIEREAGAVRSTLAELADDTGWMVSRDDQEMRLLYKHQKGGTGHSLKVRVTLNHPLENILALANEFDLMKTWNKFATDALKVWQGTMYEGIMYGAQWMPRPFRQFYALMRAQGYDLAEEEQSVIIMLEDVTPTALPPSAAPLPPAHTSRKVCNVRRGSAITLKPLPAAEGGQPRTLCFLLVHIDPHIPFTPAFLINFVLGVLAPYLVSQIKQVLVQRFTDPSDDYPTRIRDNPELYGHVLRRLAAVNEHLNLGYKRYKEVEEEAGGRGHDPAAAARTGREEAGEGGVEGGVRREGGEGSSAQAVGKAVAAGGADDWRHQHPQSQRVRPRDRRGLGELDTFDEADFQDALEEHPSGAHIIV